MASDLPSRRRLRKRLLLPALLLVVLTAVVGWLYWYGTVAESGSRDPRSPADGAVTQLLDEHGDKVIRCAVLVEAPPGVVWRVVTDYDRQAEFLPYLGQMSGERLGEGRVQIRGVAHSRLWGDWPFESVVTETEQPDADIYSSYWEERNEGPFAVSRGGWSVSPNGEGRTLLVYTLQIEMRRYPAFLIRTVLRNRVGSVLLAVRREAERRADG